MDNTSNAILGIISGAAIGVGIGILFAPKKGEDTREMISEQAKEVKNTIQRQCKNTTSRLTTSARKSLSEFENSLDDTLYNANDKADVVVVALQKRLDELLKENNNFQKK